jgi:MoaA/NifB/PqqE/SkfB family radical SAM enzyme
MLSLKQRWMGQGIMVNPTLQLAEKNAFSQCWYVALSIGLKNSGLLKTGLPRSAFIGFKAGRVFCDIRFDGDGWPCNFIPVAAGNVLQPTQQVMAFP